MEFIREYAFQIILLTLGFIFELSAPLLEKRRKTIVSILGGFLILTAIAWAISEAITNRQSVNVPTITPEPTATDEPATAEPIPDVVVRPAFQEYEYFVRGSNIDSYDVGDPLVVYALDEAGSEFAAGLMYVIEANTDNLIARVMFERADRPISSLEALRVDGEVEGINLGRMRVIDSNFVGFTLEDEGLVSLSPNAFIVEGDQLEAVQLTQDANIVYFDPPIKMSVERIQADGNSATVALFGENGWPLEGTLLQYSLAGGSHDFALSDYIVVCDVQVREGNTVAVSADGIITVGVNVGTVGPEGKERFSILGFPTPIDPEHDIVPRHPHGALLFRVQGEDDWMSFHETKQFEAQTSGCLEFDMNDSNNADNSGTFAVTVEVTP